MERRSARFCNDADARDGEGGLVSVPAALRSPRHIAEGFLLLRHHFQNENGAIDRAVTITLLLVRSELLSPQKCLCDRLTKK